MSDRKRIVSVVIGTKDRPQTLRAALESIRALEGPDLTFQICIGDNGSDKATRVVAEEFGAFYGTSAVRGCPAARNVAMEKVSGDFVAFLDDDDVWLPGHIRPHIALLDANQNIDAVFSQYIYADSKLENGSEPFPPEAPDDGDFFKKMLNGYFPQVGSTVARGNCVKKYGLMDPTLIGDSDWDWQMRIAVLNKVAFLKVPAILFRGRPLGTYDKLQFNRFLYTTRIFLRHAIPHRARLGGLIALPRALLRCVQGYYWYFCEKALTQASQGNRKAAFIALVRAFVIAPPTALKDLFFRPSSQLRGALSRLLGIVEGRKEAPRAGS